jgi:hypothetical protein
MAASITTESTTLEGQFLELARELEVAEQGEGLNRMNISFNVNAGTVIITATLPATFGGTGNAMTFSVSEYLGLNS